MLLQPALALPPHSGFVAFDGGGAAAPLVDRPRTRHDQRGRLERADPPAERPSAESASPPAAAVVAGMPQSAVWAPAIGVRARRVEGVVIIAICAYFVFGFLKLVHWM